MEWQPIATGPRDGTKVLLLYDGDQISLGIWHKPDKFHPDGWWSAYRATHWMPLPAPPTPNPC